MIHPRKALQKASCQCPCFTLKWPSPLMNRCGHWADREVLLFLKLSRSGAEAAPSVTCSWVPTTLTFRKPSRNRLPLSASNTQPYSFQNYVQRHSQAFYLFASASRILAAMMTKIVGQQQYTQVFPDGSVGKESTCNAEDPSSIPGLGRSAGKGIGYPHQ